MEHGQRSPRIGRPCPPGGPPERKAVPELNVFTPNRRLPTRPTRPSRPLVMNRSSVRFRQAAPRESPGQSQCHGDGATSRPGPAKPPSRLAAARPCPTAPEAPAEHLDRTGGSVQVPRPTARRTRQRGSACSPVSPPEVGAPRGQLRSRRAAHPLREVRGQARRSGSRRGDRRSAETRQPWTSRTVLRQLVCSVRRSVCVSTAPGQGGSRPPENRPISSLFGVVRCPRA